MTFALQGGWTCTSSWQDNNGNIATMRFGLPGDIDAEAADDRALAVVMAVSAISSAGCIGFSVSRVYVQTDTSLLSSLLEGEVERKLVIPLSHIGKRKAARIEVPSPSFDFEQANTDYAVIQGDLAALTALLKGANGVADNRGTPITITEKPFYRHRNRAPNL